MRTSPVESFDLQEQENSLCTVKKIVGLSEDLREKVETDLKDDS